MSRPIKLTDELIESLVDDFKEKLKKTRLSDGKLDYKASITAGADKHVNVGFSNLAYTKMLSLVMCFDDEVAWHGTVERDGDNFYITDVMVYPQTVTGATVNTDQDEYTDWLYAFDDDTFNKIRFQGHSHVNMGVTPSATDLTHQESILTQLSGDDFYIFFIMNKRMQMFIRVFDLAENVMYETDDVRLFLGNDGLNIANFIADAKTLVTKKTYYSAKGTKGSKKKDEDSDWKRKYYGDEFDDVF